MNPVVVNDVAPDDPEMDFIPEQPPQRPYLHPGPPLAPLREPDILEIHNAMNIEGMENDDRNDDSQLQENRDSENSINPLTIPEESEPKNPQEKQ